MKIFILISLALTLSGCLFTPDDGTVNLGKDGHNALIEMVANDPHCPAGGDMILSGLDMNNNGVLDCTEVQYSADICNGVAGATGAVGPTGPVGQTGAAGVNANVSPFLPVAAISPCGVNSSSYKEVLLGLANGDIYAEFTGGSSTSDVRNAFIPDGNYQDTDSSACNFSVTTSPDGDRSISWNGGSANYTAATLSWNVSY